MKRLPSIADAHFFNGKTNAKGEMDLVRLMPTIINQLKNRELGRLELKRMNKTYGDLWPLIIEEASRDTKTEMNPIIEILLNVSELQNIEGGLKKLSNDIERNTVNLISHRGRTSSRLSKLRLKTNLTPAQRLLKVVALLIRESIIKNSVKLNKPKTIQSSEKTVKMPKMNLFRNKRNVLESHGDNQNELNALQSLIDGQNDPSDVSDTDYMYEDDNNDNYARSGAAASTQRDEQQKLRREEQEKQLSFINSDDYHDYAFDTTDTDQLNEEEDMLRKYYGHHRRAAYEDYDSFSDLMRLAAAHDNRDTRFMKRLHYDLLNDDNSKSDEVEYNEFDYV